MESNNLMNFSSAPAPIIACFNHSKISFRHSNLEDIFKKPPVRRCLLNRKCENGQSYSEEIKAYHDERMLRLNGILL